MASAEGKVAPPFELQDGAGKTVSLADFAGKDVVLYFYPRDDTPGCTKEACGFRDDWKELAEARRGRVRRLAGLRRVAPEVRAKYKLPFTAALRSRQEGDEEYGAYGEKMLYGKKTMGVIRSTVWIGTDGKVQKHWARVPKAEEHPEKVLEAIARPARKWRPDPKAGPTASSDLPARR